MSMTQQQLGEITAYIQRWDDHMDIYFGGRCAPAGKRLLVLGSGWGVETLWALKRGAREVVGIDPRPAMRDAVERALTEQGLTPLGDRFTLHQATALTAGELGAFNIVLSNNVLEHVNGLSANLAALARFMPDQDARFVVFTAPLYASSRGHHLPIGAWQHLSSRQEEIKARVTSNQWREYRHGLNGMTITDFLAAVREAGMIVLELSVRCDEAVSQLPGLLGTLPTGFKPMDLALEGISCTLAFPHNL